MSCAAQDRVRQRPHGLRCPQGGTERTGNSSRDGHGQEHRHCGRHRPALLLLQARVLRPVHTLQGRQRLAG